MKKQLNLMRCYLKAVFGFLVFLKTRKTPNWAYQNFIRLFCLSEGKSNDFFAKIYLTFNPPCAISLPVKGILGAIECDRLTHISKQLNEKGFYIFEDRLPIQICQQLVDFSLSRECWVENMDDHAGGKNQQVKSSYQRNNPLGQRYRFYTDELVDNEIIQSFIADPSFISVSQAYLRSCPTLDVLSMWWSTSFCSTPQKEAAQWYHFDLDRIRWLKFFIYLTDVDSDKGPHTFVAGSHKSGRIPKKLLSMGYQRISDEEVESFYKPEDILEFNGTAGTIIAEDTRGLHKGRHLLTGDRLILQLQFSTGIFGASHPRMKPTVVKNHKLKEMIQQYPKIYSPLYGNFEVPPVGK